MSQFSTFKCHNKFKLKMASFNIYLSICKSSNNKNLLFLKCFLSVFILQSYLYEKKFIDVSNMNDSKNENDDKYKIGNGKSGSGHQRVLKKDSLKENIINDISNNQNTSNLYKDIVLEGDDYLVSMIFAMTFSVVLYHIFISILLIFQ